MTLPSTCLPVETPVIPGGPVACAGATVPASGAAPDGTPFANLLSQAATVGAGTAAPATGAASATPLGSTAPLTENSAATYQGICYTMNFSQPAGQSRATATALPTSSPVDGATVQTAECEVPADAAVPETESPVPLDGISDQNIPTGGPGLGKGSSSAMSVVPPGVRGAAPAAAKPSDAVKPGAVVEETGSPLKTNAEQPEPWGSTPSTDKQKPRAKLEDSSNLPANPEALTLAYQLIAGQWVPQPAAQSPVLPASTPSTDAQSGEPVDAPETTVASPFTATTATTSIDRPTPKSQKAALAALYPGDTQKTAGEGARGSGLPFDATADSRPAVAIPAPATKSAMPSDPSSGSTAAAPSAAAAPAQAEATAASVTILSGNDSRSLTSTPLSAPASRLVSTQPVKIAAPDSDGRAEPATGGFTSNSAKEKKLVTVDSKSIKWSAAEVGTDAANRDIPMPYSVANKTPAAVLPASASADVPGQSQNDNGAVLAANAHYSAQAPKLVEEIRQIADRISVIDRNSVEVKFDFGDRDHLSVRVEYREGTVHTTFRTDSSQLRDAISHEWQAQNVAQDQRSYRVSEPVFSATTNDRQNFSTAGDGSGRQRSSEQPAHPAAPSYSSGRNGGGGSTATAPVGRSSRPETSRHLHALA